MRLASSFSLQPLPASCFWWGTSTMKYKVKLSNCGKIHYRCKSMPVISELMKPTLLLGNSSHINMYILSGSFRKTFIRS
jgi:hypothetical protein